MAQIARATLTLCLKNPRRARPTGSEGVKSCPAGGSRAAPSEAGGTGCTQAVLRVYRRGTGATTDPQPPHSRSLSVLILLFLLLIVLGGGDIGGRRVAYSYS